MSYAAGTKLCTHNAVNFENGLGGQLSGIFKHRSNFSSKVICNVGAKVMFLTNSMLADKDIVNGSIGVITDLGQ
jgi:hypothetical protein